MLNFNDAFNEILGGITQPNAVVQVIPVNPRFEEFKQWVVGYVLEHDQLEPHHPTLQQLPNMGSVESGLTVRPVMSQILSGMSGQC